MTEKTASPSRGWILGLSVLVILIALGIWRLSARSAVPVRIAQAARVDMTSTVSTNGIVEPVQDFQAQASAAGQVAEVYVSNGEHVAAGAPLVRLNDVEARSRVAAAKASLDAAAASLANLQHGGTADENLSSQSDLASALSQQKTAAAALASTQALADKGSASANEVANARQRLSDAQARVAQLQTRRSSRYSSVDISAQQSQVAQARAAYAAAVAAAASLNVRAPFAGTIYSLPVVEYDYVQAAAPLLNMADLRHIQVRAYFDEPDTGKLREGQPVSIVWEGRPGMTWHGHVLLAPMTVMTQGTRHVGECLISIDDATGDLLPNTNVTVAVTAAQKKGVLGIPREALHTYGPRNFVYRIVDGKLSETDVQVGTNVTLLRAEITGGLAEGQTVVVGTANGTELTDGMAVKAVR